MKAIERIGQLNRLKKYVRAALSPLTSIFFRPNCLQMISVITVPKFAISQSEAKSNVLISDDIKSLT